MKTGFIASLSAFLFLLWLSFFPSQVWNTLIAVDQLGNAITFGDPDETISSRLGKAERKGSEFAAGACRLLAWFEKDHCQVVIEHDRGDPTSGEPK